MRRSVSLQAALLGGVVIGLFSAAARSAGAQELLTNPSLDQTYQQEIVPGFSLPKPANWVNEGTRAISGPYEDEMSSEPWAGPAPTPNTGAGDMGVFFKPFSGNATNGAATGHLYQDNPATPGLLYTLTGWAGAEANMLGGAQLAVEFLDAGGAEIPTSGAELDLRAAGLLTPNGQPFNYKRYSVSALAPAGAARVRARASMLNGTSNPLGGGQALVFDDLSLTAIPEPVALAPALIGAAMLLRRRAPSRRPGK